MTSLLSHLNNNELVCSVTVFKKTSEFRHLCYNYNILCKVNYHTTHKLWPVTNFAQKWELGIREIFASGICNPGNFACGFRNPGLWN